VNIDTGPPVDLIARVADLPESEVVRRLNQAHGLFLLRLDDQPAAYGWSATGPAEIGGLALAFTVPQGERYLWDFVTLPAYRGQGLYPLLLQEILRLQMSEAKWFWIGHEPANEASRRGIIKAGFKLAGRVLRLPRGELGFAAIPDAEADLARRAARALGLKVA
jgi:GNAT superfamily N-acetyltransferase